MSAKTKEFLICMALCSPLIILSIFVAGGMPL
jgi:hypothetical protein